MKKKYEPFLVIAILVLAILVLDILKPSVTGNAVGIDATKIDPSQATNNILDGTFSITINAGDQIKSGSTLQAKIMNGSYVYAEKTLTVDEAFSWIGVTPNSGVFSKVGTYTFPIKNFGLNPTFPGAHFLTITLSEGSVVKKTITKQINFAGFYDVILLSESDAKVDESLATYRYKAGENIFCFFSYPRFGTPQVSFYKDRSTVPVVTRSGTEIDCDLQDAQVCAGSYKVTDSSASSWTCEAKVTYNSKVSSKKAVHALLPANTPPETVKDFLPATLAKDGFLSYDLNAYFKDADNNQLTFQVKGATLVDAKINGAKLEIRNMQNIAGNELLFVTASDGIDSSLASLDLNVEGNQEVIQTPEPVAPQQEALFQEEVATTLPVEETPQFTPTPASGGSYECVSQWVCELTECSAGFQTKTCRDLNECGNPTPLPETLSCGNSDSNSLASEGELPSVSEQTQGVQIVTNRKPATTTQIIVLVGAILALLTGIVLMVFSSSKGRKPSGQFSSYLPKKGLSIHEVQRINETENLYELEQYADNAVLNEGRTLEEVRSEVEGAGWKKQDVTRVLAYVGAKKFVKASLESGVKKEDIKERLKAKKWSDNTIQRIFRELQK